MTQMYRWKRNDTGLTATTTLLGPDGAVDLNGATVKFIMRRVGNGVAKVDAAATIVGAAAGEVAYDRQAADTDESGVFHGEYEVTFAGGTTQTFPSDGYIIVRIDDDLG